MVHANKLISIVVVVVVVVAVQQLCLNGGMSFHRASLWAIRIVKKNQITFFSSHKQHHKNLKKSL